MKYCVKCGAALQDDALFCDKCGNKVGESTISQMKNDMSGTNNFNLEKSNLSEILHKCVTSSFLFSTNGRLNRAPYNVLWMVFIAISFLVPPLTIVFLIPNICIVVKRLHDLNKSGKLLLWILGIAILLGAVFFGEIRSMWINNITNSSLTTLVVIMYVMVIFDIVMLIVNVFLMCIKGTTGPNKYGDDLLLSVEENDRLKGQQHDNKEGNTVDDGSCVQKENPVQNGANNERKTLSNNAINKNVKNRISAGVLLAGLGCFVFFCSHDPTKGLQVGDCVKFGTYADEPIEWRVLAVDSEKKLLVTEYGIDTIKYNKYNQSITWEDSYIRWWLNEKLYLNAFNQSERKRIIKANVVNGNNPKYGTYGGENTLDYLFCLSADEVDKYLKEVYYLDFNFRRSYRSDELARKCFTTFYAMKKEKILNTDWKWEDKGSERNHKKEIRNRIKDLNSPAGMTCPWWLRTPGRYRNYAVYVQHDGKIDYEGDIITDEKFMNVRPAMWIKN